MITKEQFEYLSQHLSEINRLISPQHGRAQNKEYERKLPKLFEYESYDELNSAIETAIERGIISSNEEQANYYRHRWFAYKSSEVDDYMINGVLADYASSIKKYNLVYSGIVMLKKYADNLQYIFKTPLYLIDVLYKEERSDFHHRRKLKNRCFIAYHSFVDPSREPFLRSDFFIRSRVFAEYIRLFGDGNHELYPYYHNRKTDIIFIIEKEDNSIWYGFGSENINKPINLVQLN